MLDRLIEIDQNVTLWLNQFNSPATDQFWAFFSASEVWFPFYGVIAGLMIWRLGWKRGLIAIVTMALMVVFMDQTANLVKNTVARLRPCYNTAMIEGGLHYPELRGGYFGFFSGHSCNSFGFAMTSYLLFRFDKRLKYRGYCVVIFTWAALVGFSRIMMGKHFAGDVFVGAMYGMFFGALFATAGCRVMKKATN